MEDETRQHTPLREIGNTPNSELKQGSHSKAGIEDQQRYTLLMKQARKAAEEGHPRECLQILIKASKIYRSEKVMKRIAKLEEFLKENGSESESEEDSGVCHVGKGFYVHAALFQKLYSYQREAMLWFWRLHRKNKGGILGDDMGLGKTIQVIAFLSGLFYLDQVKTVLVVLPVALIINWEKEFDKWAPGIFVESHHSSKRERERALAKVQRRGGVLLTSYGLVLTNHELLSHRHASPFTWDYVILDEGHKIKNPSKTTKAVHKVPATHRLILTGTPIQNSLKELWSLFDFVTQGSLLGTAQTFNAEYANPITRAREKDATGGERLLGNQMAESLRELIAPYFLRRTKADVVKRREEHAKNLEDKEQEEADNGTEDRVPEFPTLTRKNDFVIWLHLTEAQIKIYRDFLSLDQVKQLLMTTRSPLVELTILKKLCDHPRLLPVRACIQLGLEATDSAWDGEDDDLELPASRNQTKNSSAIQAIADHVLMAESGKLMFLVNLLTNLRQEGHRTLVFSQSRKMLDIIEKVLKNKDFEVMRLDGTITKLEDREKRISSFQHNDHLSVFLLTTQVGGVGLTLTGADRVVIFDPSWNPATDSQAVDRVCRIGQTRSVIVYRLITCGSVEEKIYRRQIFKDSVTKQATGASQNPYRYFSRGELRDLFILDNPQTSTTQLALQEMHAAQRKTDTQLDEHIAFLYSLDMFGLTDHDLMFSQEADTENKEEQEQAAEYIQHRVSRAKELVSAESDLSQKLKEQISQDTEGPGSMQRHHRQYGDRQSLLDHAAKLGEEVNVPAFDKRRDDYDRKNQPASETESEEEEEDLNMSMANMTLEEPQSEGNPHVAKSVFVEVENFSFEEVEERTVSTSPMAASRQSLSPGSPPRPISTAADAGVLEQNADSVYYVESEEDEEEARKTHSGFFQPSDQEAQATVSPGDRPDSLMDESAVVEQQTVSTSPVATSRQSLSPESPPRPISAATDAGVLEQNVDSDYYMESEEEEEVRKTHSGLFMPSDQEANATVSPGDRPDSLMDESAVVEQQTVSTSPVAASRQSLSPDSPPRPISSATDAGVLEQNVDSDYYVESEEDKEEEVRKTHSKFFPPSDQEAKATVSPGDRPDSLMDESAVVEQRTVSTSPVAASRQSLSPERPPRSISAATDAGVLEQNMDSDYFMESEEDEEEDARKTHSGFFQPSDQEAKANLSPGDRPDSLMDESAVVEQRSVALSPMNRDDDTASEGSSGNTSVLTTSPQQSGKGQEDDDDALQQVRVSTGQSETGTGKAFRYYSDADSQGLCNSTDMQGSMDVTRQLSFDETTAASRLEGSSSSDEDKYEKTDEDEGDEAPAEGGSASDEDEYENTYEDEGDEAPAGGSSSDEDKYEKTDEDEGDEARAEGGSSSDEVEYENTDEVEGHEAPAEGGSASDEDKYEKTDEDEGDEAPAEGGSSSDEDKYENTYENEGHEAPAEGGSASDEDEYENTYENEGDEAPAEGGSASDEDEYEKTDEDEGDEAPAEGGSASDEVEYENTDADEGHEALAEGGSSSDEVEYENTDEDEGDEADGDEEDSLTEEQQQRYQDLVTKGRLHQSKDNLKKALACYLTALEIDSSDRQLQRCTYKLAQQYKKQANLA